MQSFLIRNDKFEFWRGLRIAGASFSADLANLWFTRGHVPTQWKPLPISTRSIGQDLEIEFSYPCNALQFRLDIAGHQAGSLTIAPLKIERQSLGDTKALIANKKIIFIGCARDCEDGVNRSLHLLGHLGKAFGDYEIAIYENDSKDQTERVLREYQANLKLTVFSETGLQATVPARTGRLAYARNKLMSWALNRQSDYIAVVDMDTVLTERFSNDSFFSNFTLEPAWDAVFPVNEDFYYDLWALRKEGLVEADYQIRMNELDAAMGITQCRWLGAHNLQTDLRDSPGWIDVASAFGGMGVYKTEIILKAKPRYLGHDILGAELCEHVPFHAALKQNGANLYINPEFIVGTTKINPAKGHMPKGIWEIYSKD